MDLPVRAVGEEPVTAEVVAQLHRVAELAVLDGDLVLGTALADELEGQLLPVDLDVTGFERGEPELLVPRGLRVADPDQRLVEQPYDQGDHPLPREPPTGQIAGHLAADHRQARPERGQLRELVGVPRVAPVVVVAVLLSAPIVAAGGLDVPLSVGTAP